MCLARTGGHLYHHIHIPMKLPLLKEAEFHLLLVVAKMFGYAMFVCAIHDTDTGHCRLWEGSYLGGLFLFPVHQSLHRFSAPKAEVLVVHLMHQKEEKTEIKF